MLKIDELLGKLFKIENTSDFNALAMEIFQYQLRYNQVYANYVENLRINVDEINTVEEIPFLPIEFFKKHKIVSGSHSTEQIFESSGTTEMMQSRHYITDLMLYEQSFMYGFSYFFGDIKDYCVLALLPSYLEREGSSLVYMAEKLIKLSNNNQSGFYLHNLDELAELINTEELKSQKIILLGVTYALLDLAEKYTIKHPDLIVMETGGMKGKRKELVREELHEILTKGLNVNHIFSEYGMTELLSQAYSRGNGIFECPPWMKVMIRDANDPLSLVEDGKNGGINIIDLANIHSCSFIMTQDLGKKHHDRSFEILGRFDSSDVRGCNLLVG